jgi:S-adenosylmethionine:tRNA ribosyltransferase-isomerase
MRVADFDFELPERLIAQHPPPERGESRCSCWNAGPARSPTRRLDSFPNSSVTAIGSS